MDKKALVKGLEPFTSRVRTDVTAKKVKGRKNSVWTSEALTEELLLHHVNGGPARGCCPIKAGEDVTMVGTYDLDSHKGEVSWQDMARVALTLIGLLERDGMKPHAFRSSGGRGIHIWLLWDEAQDAHSVRVYMRDVLSRASWPEGKIGAFKDGTKGVGAGQIEIFPKQSYVSELGKGNLIILPLAGESEPLEPAFGLEPMGKEYIEQMDFTASAPVPFVQKPAQNDAVIDLGERPSKELMFAALRALNNKADGLGLDYDNWFMVLCGIKYWNSGRAGHELALKWSEQNPVHNLDDFERTWKAIKNQRDDPSAKLSTWETVFGLAEKFANWTGALESKFEVVEVSPEDAASEVVFKRDRKGAIEAVIENVITAISTPAYTGYEIGYDEFKDELMITVAGQKAWRAFKDADYVDLRVYLANKGFKPVGRELMRDAVTGVAEKNRFDSAVMWLAALEWDGVPRIERFYEQYFNAESSEYCRAVSLYTWTAMAGRVMQPGIKVDMVPILVGAQGLRKSSGVAAMVPSHEFHCEISLAEKDDNLSRKMRGVLVAELPELSGLGKREIESTKAFITQRFENWIPKFKEFAFTFPRRLVFIGTTNETEFLIDSTGNRRWLPLRVNRVNVDAIERDCLQLWAEAKARFSVDGVIWQQAETLAKEVHAEFEVSDEWEGMIAEWLAKPVEGDVGGRNGDGEITTRDIALWVLGIEGERLGPANSRKIVSILKKLGYVLVRPRDENGVRYRSYVHKDNPNLIFGEYVKPDEPNDTGQLEVPF